MRPDAPGASGAGFAPEDRSRLEHMRRSSQDHRTIVGADDAMGIASDIVRARALVNCFTDVGEAASRPSQDARQRVGGVPWRQIVGMRNIIVHVYWGIDLNLLVKTVHDDLPELIAALDAALRNRPGDDPAAA